jgi:hypothetical protein
VFLLKVTIVDRAVMIVHGGISPSVRLDAVEALDRFHFHSILGARKV